MSAHPADTCDLLQRYRKEPIEVLAVRWNGFVLDTRGYPYPCNAEIFEETHSLIEPCVRCGKPGTESFDLCADSNALRSLCDDCDIELNTLVLHWAGDPEADSKIDAYRVSKGAEVR